MTTRAISNASSCTALVLSWGSRVVLLILLVTGSPRTAFALGEVFKMEAVGTEYCGHFINSKFTAKTNIDLFVLVASPTQLIVSSTPTFEEGTAFPVTGHTYLTSTTKAAFVGGILFQSLPFATVQSTIVFDKFGSIKSLSGVFTQDSVFRAGCFSSGKFKTVQRLL